MTHCYLVVQDDEGNYDDAFPQNDDVPMATEKTTGHIIAICWRNRGQLILHVFG